MRFRLRTLLIVLALGLLVLAGVDAWMWNRLSVSNCGGNNAARSHVSNIYLLVKLIAAENQSAEFSISLMSQADGRRMAELSRFSWTRDAEYFISTKPFRLATTDPKQIVIFCNRPFTNVPRYIFGEAPPTYAVGFTDGSTSLLTTKEYVALHKTRFISLSAIQDIPAGGDGEPVAPQ